MITDASADLATATRPRHAAPCVSTAQLGGEPMVAPSRHAWRPSRAPPRRRTREIGGELEYSNRLGMFATALDLEALLAPPPARGRRGAPLGRSDGRRRAVHVNDIGAARHFYVDVLGLQSMADLATADFLAGPAVTHLGISRWRGHGIPAAPDPAAVVGLRHWTILLPAAAEVAPVHSRLSAAAVPVHDRDGDLAVRDPAGITVVVTPSN